MTVKYAWYIGKYIRVSLFQIQYYNQLYSYIGSTYCGRTKMNIIVFVAIIIINYIENNNNNVPTHDYYL